MPPVILRPDNFLDPIGKTHRIVKADSAQELIQQIHQVYGLEQHMQSIELRLYTSPFGVTNRRRLDLTAPLSQTDPLTVYIAIRPIAVPGAAVPDV